MRSARPQLVLLALVAACSLTYYAASVSAALFAVYGDRVPRNPTFHGLKLQTVTGMHPEAEQAGVHLGDVVTAIDGRPFTGYTVLLEELKHSHAGGQMRLNIQSPGAASSHTVSIRLAPVYPSRPGTLELISQVYFLNILFPLACLLLGFWVVAARPRDKNAWFLLGILEYFVLIFAANQFWPGALFAFTSIWNAVGMAVGPLCIMLFGIYFPERSRYDISLPWIKWALIAAFAILLFLASLYSYGFVYSFSSIAWLAPVMGPVFRTLTILAMIAFSLYFLCLGEKTGTAKSPDIRRRLRILYIGSTAGNGPGFLLVLYSLFTGQDFGGGVPAYLVITAIFFFTLFPGSLAYVVVVHRAMDLRIILRQGTRYALARSSLWFLRAFAGLLFAVALTHALKHRPIGFQDLSLVILLGALLLLVRYRTTKVISLWIDRRFFREAYSADQVLNDLATQAQAFTDVPPLVRTVSDCIAGALHVDRIAVLLRSGDTFRLQYAVGLDLGSEILLNTNSKTIANLDLVRSPATVYLDNPDAWLLAATDAERKALRALGAEMLLPLRGRNRLLGVMALGPKRSEEPYSRTDRGLLQSVATHTGLSIENSELIHSLAIEAGQRERIHREIEVAREVQERFLPQSYPAIPGVELAGAYRAAQGVGGDYYDFIEMKAVGPAANGAPSLGIAIGDVSGKGISAALLMASLRASLRGLTRRSDGDLASMMREINHLVYEASASNRYATFFFAQLDPVTRRLTYVNAGHNAPALVRHGGRHSSQPEILRLTAGGPVIGLIEDSGYEQSSLILEPGDILLAFTDGISEAMTVEGEEWSEDRLIALLACCPEQPAASLAQHLIEAADAFAAGAPQHDDMTLLILKIQPNASSLPAAPHTLPEK